MSRALAFDPLLFLAGIVEKLTGCVWRSTERVRISALLAAGACTFHRALAAEPNVNQAELSPQLELSFQRLTGEVYVTADTVVWPNISLYVPEGISPTPFVPAGRFRAIWKGFLSSELRADYRFRAEFRGQLQLVINGDQVLAETNSSASLEISPMTRLRKGTNSIHLTFTSPLKGDAYLRLSWIPKGGQPSPLPAAQLSHAAGGRDLNTAVTLQLGRELMLQSRCANCHSVGLHLSQTEATMDAPSFEGIGSRLRPDWMAAWIANPRAERPLARMPRLLPGAAPDAITAIAAYLATLTLPAPAASATPAGKVEGDAVAGSRLFENLHCIACHDSPEGTESDPSRISLKSVANKFVPGALAAFLLRPDGAFAWTRMPDFQLTPDEAGQLAAYLDSKAEPIHPAAAHNGEDLVRRGQELVQTSGCLNCHAATFENKFRARPFSELTSASWTGGCMASTPAVSGQVPDFAFSPEQREALQRFATADRAALTREAPGDFARSHLASLRCGECHGKFEGFPSLDAIHGKLKPEWANRLIAGELTYRPRPWLRARMPAFRRYADGVARGMAILAGFPPASEAESTSDPEKAAVGRKLVSAEGGMSCLACHALGAIPATQVFENAGINFAYTSTRLLKPYYERWLRNPIAIDPVSKMPVFFDDELRSVLLDVYEGDGAKQIEAIWQYLLLGDKMPPPPGAQSGARAPTQSFE